MTHIHPPIRADSTKFLAWTLNVGGEQVVRETWCKLLEGFSGLLGWSVQGGEKARIQLARGGSILGNVVITSRHISTLSILLSLGLSQSEEKSHRKARTLKYGSGMGHSNRTIIQHPWMEAYFLPSHSAPFAYLNLFTSPLLTNQQSSHDIPSRRIQFTEYIPPLLNCLYDLAAELGPDVGRQGNQVQVDELRVAIVRILGVVKGVYREEDEVGEQGKRGKGSWEKEWKRCIGKVRGLIEGRTRSEGSRKVIREWELANLDSDS
jgi:pre-rRNA-processing protein IPI1